MSHETIALLLWSLLGLSIVLTIVGIGVQEPWILFVAAAISFGFAIVAMFSIGIFVLVGTIIQVVVGVAMRRGQQATTTG
jgi:hypothetical protein